MKTRFHSISTFICLILATQCQAGIIHDAVTKHDPAALDRALKTEPKQINSRCYPDFRTPLHMAVAAGEPGMVKLLLDSGADPTLRGPDSLSSVQTETRLWETPLQRAVVRLGESRPFRIGNIDTPDWQLPPMTLHEWTKAHLKAVSAVSSDERGSRLDVLRLLLQQKPHLDKGFVQGLQPLHAAAAVGDAEVVRLLIGSGADVNGRTARTWLTPLHFAAIGLGGHETLNQLIAAGARVETADRRGRTPLMFAACSGSLPAVKALVAHHADPGAEDISRRTVIGYAAGAGHDEVVRFLYQKGGRDLIRLARQDQLFANAATGGSRQLVELLLAEGLDVDLRDETGATPLLNACWNHPELARFLIGKGADKTARTKGGTGLFSIACFAGHAAMAKELIADKVVRGGDSSLLADAAMAGRPELLKTLIDQGGDVNFRNKYGATPLESAILGPRFAEDHPQLRISASRDDYADVVELLLKHGARVNPTADDQPALVHLAAQNGGARIMRALLKAGGSPKSPTGEDGRTPLQIAAAHGPAETVRVLLDAGADPEQVDHLGYTMLHVAANEANLEVVKLLIKGKSSLDARNQSTGETPLHCAVFSNSLECVRLLLAAGSDPDAVTSDHLTAVTLAIDLKDLPEAPPSREEARYWQRTADLLSRLRIIHELIEAGASTTVVPPEYRSLTEYARDRGCPEIVELVENPPQVARKTGKRSPVTPNACRK